MQLTDGRYLGCNTRTWGIDGISITETEYHDKVFEGWHSHANLHMSLILEGGNLEYRRSLEIEAVPGTLLFYAAGEIHRNRKTKHPSRNINLEIDERFFSKYGLTSLTDDSQLSSRVNAKFALLKIYRECLYSECCAETSAPLLLLKVFAGKDRKKTGTAGPSWINTTRAIINDRWNENISLAELSQAAQVHPVTISKHFPRYFNCTLAEYVRQLRIEKSLALVKNPALSLTEVAYECGFFDQSHFIHAFKRSTGFLPGQYKKL